ncbi:WXG100 family type VII secretion target [Catenulispora sp. NF23]|uniref:WXG100 family type VII secretion target n=1 Tax=Catenulispora pinistramenti TaxID=2705254 RepID=A0ABS5L203_9ACTN|nr:WXG100 family type VII secretion target [Catenulispora pinistramenti]MBS2535806.1 WXG100 family type VII secretion target [Catenulispora pinistramenti]MBS2552257.1 WXG100 family type VII secretion target [Catenulispora pinistramenti]
MANLNVTYGEMHTAAGQLTHFEQQLEDTLRQAQAMVSNLVQSGFVTDQASKAFDESYSNFTKGATQMIQGITGMVNYLNSAADQLAHTDTALANAIKGK